MAFAVFAGGEGDFIETSAELGGFVFAGNPSGSHDDDAPWTEEYALGFMGQEEEEDPGATGQDPWGGAPYPDGGFGRAPRRTRHAASPRMAATAEAWARHVGQSQAQGSTRAHGRAPPTASHGAAVDSEDELSTSHTGGRSVSPAPGPGWDPARRTSPWLP